MSRLFKNFDTLKEHPEEDDFLGYSEEIYRVEERIKQAIDNSQPTIVAYLGSFGVGKSTILRNVKLRNRKQYTWVEFDTWRYSNRSELWDAFVIKVSAELSRRKDERDIADEIDGSELNLKAKILLWIWIIAVWFFATVLSIYLWNSFKTDAGFWEAYLKYATPVIAPILLLVGLGRVLKISYLSDERPLRRTLELESLLYRKLDRSKKPIVVIVEDVDRSGRDGAIFMETLHEFLGDKTFKEPIVVIAPQSSKGFEISAVDRSELEHSLKVYDEKIFFNSKMSHASIDLLYSKLEFYEEYKVFKPAMIEITKELVYYYQAGQLTIRMLKHILREVEWFMQSHPDHNPAIVLVFSIAKMVNDSTRNGSAVSRLRRTTRPAPHTTPEGEKKYIIDSNNVLTICLAMAVGAKGEALSVGLVDSAGKYNQDTKVRLIKTDLNAIEDSLIRDQENVDEVTVSVRPGYK